MESSSFTCFHCHEIFSSWYCKECKKIIISRCRSCHNEIVHNQIPKPRPLFPSRTSDPVFLSNLRYHGWGAGDDVY